MNSSRDRTQNTNNDKSNNNNKNKVILNSRNNQKRKKIKKVNGNCTYNMVNADSQNSPLRVWILLDNQFTTDIF